MDCLQAFKSDGSRNENKSTNNWEWETDWELPDRSWRGSEYHAFQLTHHLNYSTKAGAKRKHKANSCCDETIFDLLQ